MQAGFRKSLFGFNSDDVMEYIEKSHKEFVEKETVLNEKVEDLSSQLESAKAQIAEILSEKAVIEAELSEYTAKYDEIERLSQNIGRLYLVAETNASSVIEAAKQNRDISQVEITKSIDCVEKTHSSLSNLREEINKTSAEFSAKLQSLIISLEKTKSDIYNNDSVSDKKIDEYEELLRSIKA